jgi:hypothetical protein
MYTVFFFIRRRYRSKDRDETYRRQISPPPTVHPMHSISGYVTAHHSHPPRMYYPSPYMSFPRPYMRFTPGRPRFYSSEMYSTEYQPQKERLEFFWL